MNHVTHETAARLKEAGFTQPEPVFGQRWYYPLISTEYVGVLAEFNRYSGFSWLGEKGGFSRLHSLEKDKMAFAPTATDILRQLPDYWFLSVATSDPHGLYEMCTNPEELAAAWLAIHEKKE